MLMTLAPVFGVLAGVVGVVDTIPYVRDIVRGSTRPHRGTWFIWGLLAIVATACVIAADLVAAAMMVPKVYRDPGSETLVTFALAGAGGALAAGAVGAADPSLLCYPVDYCLVNWALALLIHQRRVLALTAPAPSA